MTAAIALFDPDVSYPGQSSFDCGHPVINNFVRRSLKQQVKRQLSVAYALVDSGSEDHFAGFYTIAQHMIPLDKLGQLQLASLPKQVPCTRLIMLGVSKSHQGQKLGLRLMKHALKTAKNIATVVGSAGLYLDADPGAVGFYLSLGFHLLDGDKSPAPSAMFIPLSLIP